MRVLDTAYRCCDPEWHILGTSGHVSGHAGRSRDKPAPPLARLAEICLSQFVALHAGRIAATNVFNAAFLLDDTGTCDCPSWLL